MILFVSIFIFSIFSLELTVTEQLDESDFRHYYGVNIFKQKSARVPGKVSVTQSELALRRILHQDVSLCILCSFFSQINLVYKFHIMLFR